MSQKTMLNRIRLINWMYFSNEIISLNNGSVLITGKNASGKSTILDAIQMVLTANTTKFNEAANDKSKRDLKGYVRCKRNTETEMYLRNGPVIGHVGLEFFEEEQNRYFTVGVVLVSQDENSQVYKKWYIEECNLDELNFIEENLPTGPDLFKNKDKKVVYIQTINEYQNRLLRRLSINDSKFFDVLRKTIAFRPVEDVKVFINKYVLPEKTIDVKSLRETIEVLNELENNLKRAKKERDSLEKIVQIYQSIKETQAEEKIIELLILLATLENIKIEQEKIQNEISKYSELKRIAENSFDALNAQKQKETTLLIEFQTDRKKSNLSASIEKLEDRKNEIETQIKNEKRAFEELKNQTIKLENFFKTLLAYKIDISLELSEYKIILEKDSKEFPIEQKIELIKKIENFTENTINQNRENSILAKLKKTEAEKQLAQTKTIIQKLENKNISYPQDTEKLKQSIEKEFLQRGIDSSVYILCELLEINEKEWTNAIEGYLNSQRFYLVVEPKYYNIALEVYNKSKVYGQGLINTKKIPTECTVQDNSLAQKLSCKTKDSQNYINYLLGNVICVEDIFNLENYSVAITKDCMLYKNYVARKINPAIYNTPYIGKDAIERQLKEFIKKQNELIIEIKTQEEKIQECSKIIENGTIINFEKINQTSESSTKLFELNSDLSKLKIDLAELKANPDIIELERKITEQQKKIDELQNKTDIENKNIIQNEELVKNLKSNAETDAKNYEELNSSVKEQSTEFAVEYLKAKEKFEVESKTKRPEEISNNFNPRRQTLENIRNRKYTELIKTQAEYNNEFTRDFETGIEKIQDFENAYQKLAEIEILQNEEKIKDAKKNAERIFREDFIAKMKESIEDAKYEFDNLQKALKNLTYGEDSYKFKIEPNAQKRQIYNMICDPDNQGNDTLFSNGFESKYKEEIDELFAKIQTKETSEATLEEYTDYRNYLDYDIEILKKDGRKQLLSKTIHLNSGGESQVPFYVIMAASLNSMYRSKNSVKLILMDEAFEKMDEQRISSMMDLFNRLNFQTIVFAPDQKIQDIGEKVSTVLTVIRQNTVSQVVEFDYYG